MASTLKHRTKTLRQVKEVMYFCFYHKGDVALGGLTIGERPGHFDDQSKPSGFNTKKVFLSPSIRYAGCNTYATQSR